MTVPHPYEGYSPWRVLCGVHGEVCLDRGEWARMVEKDEGARCPFCGRKATVSNVILEDRA